VKISVFEILDVEKGCIERVGIVPFEKLPQTDVARRPFSGAGWGKERAKEGFL
jgi:hypothetical protein